MTPWASRKTCVQPRLFSASAVLSLATWLGFKCLAEYFLFALQCSLSIFFCDVSGYFLRRRMFNQSEIPYPQINVSDYNFPRNFRTPEKDVGVEFYQEDIHKPSIVILVAIFCTSTLLVFVALTVWGVSLLRKRGRFSTNTWARMLQNHRRASVRRTLVRDF